MYVQHRKFCVRTSLGTQKTLPKPLEEFMKMFGEFMYDLSFENR